MKAVVRLIFLMILCLGTGCGLWRDDAREVQKKLDQAHQLYEQRDFEGVTRAYEEVLRLNPGHAEAHYQLGLIFDKNLSDPLSAAYHYQRYLKSANPDPSRVELVKSFLDNSRLQIASNIPHLPGQNSPELVRLRSENSALYVQVEELKKEMVQIRSRMNEKSRPTAKNVPATPSPVSPQPPVSRNDPRAGATHGAAIKTPPAGKTSTPRSYVVRKGEGVQAIAEKIYGDRGKWKAILKANPEIKDPNQLKPGQVLVLP